MLAARKTGKRFVEKSPLDKKKPSDPGMVAEATLVLKLDHSMCLEEMRPLAAGWLDSFAFYR